MIRIEVNSPDTQAIDGFVTRHPKACHGHRTAWLAVLRDGLGHRPLALSAWRDGQVVGWLPLVLTRSVLFGRHLVSLPYLNQAGLITEGADSERRLVEQAANLARRHRARFVELRHAEPIGHEQLTSVRRDKLAMIRQLPSDSDTLWGELNTKVRNQVRKGRKQSFDIQFGGVELLDAFYRVFAIRMRDLGTPVFPRRLFAAALHHLGDRAELCVLRDGSRAIAGALLVHDQHVTEAPSAACLDAYLPTCANMAMYWRLIERAIERGSTTFDFGRSSVDTGTYRFKKQWGAQAIPTGWQHLAMSPAARPITRDDRRYGRAIRVWQRLPVWLTRLAGPTIVRGIP